MGVNSGPSTDTVSLEPPVFQILGEGDRQGKLRTLEAAAWEGPGAAPETHFPGDCVFLPGGKRGEVRRCLEAENGRILLAVKGLPPGRRGLPRIVLPVSWASEPVQEFLWIPFPGETGGPVPGKREDRTGREGPAEILLRAAGDRDIPLAGRISLQKRRMFWQVGLSRPLWVPLGADAALPAERGGVIRGRILWTGSSGPREWGFWEDALARSGGMAGLSPRRVGLLTAVCRGWAPLYPGMMGGEDREEGLSGETLIREGAYLTERRYRDTHRRKLVRRSRRSGGWKESLLVQDSELPDDLAVHFLKALAAEGELVRRGGYVLPPEQERSESLSPAARKLLGDIREAGEMGLSRRQAEGRGLGPVVENLIRLGLAVDWAGFLVDARQWQEQLDRIVGEREPGEVLSLQEVKGETGYSRSRILPLLEALEAEGRLGAEEQGNRRVLGLNSAEKEET